MVTAGLVPLPACPLTLAVVWQTEGDVKAATIPQEARKVSSFFMIISPFQATDPYVIAVDLVSLEAESKLGSNPTVAGAAATAAATTTESPETPKCAAEAQAFTKGRGRQITDRRRQVYVVE